eukprot:2616973-Prymnesium_polylepis.2
MPARIRFSTYTWSTFTYDTSYELIIQPNKRTSKGLDAYQLTYNGPGDHALPHPSRGGTIATTSDHVHQRSSIALPVLSL